MYHCVLTLAKLNLMELYGVLENGQMKGKKYILHICFSKVISLSYRICLHDQNIIVVIIVIFQRH